jgi:hypothetical protein
VTSVDEWATLARALHSTRAEAPEPLLITQGETALDRARATLRAQQARWGTDEGAIRAAMRALTPPQMAELAADPAMIDILRDELSGADLDDAAAQLARGRIDAMAHADLATILGSPGQYGIGTIAAAIGRDVLLGHRAAVAATGTGTLQGTKCTAPKPAGVASSDCTVYVMDVLSRAFAARGLASTWSDVARTATAASGSGGLKGTELIKALQAKQRWEALFWSPDPTNPSDRDAEHPAAYKKVTTLGTYYGITVDPRRSVVNYRRTSPGAKADLSGVERLRRLQFGLLTARGGVHMAVIINGMVYEVHWDKPASDPQTITTTSLESFAWNSGAIAAPPGDLALAARIP